MCTTGGDFSSQGKVATYWGRFVSGRYVSGAKCLCGIYYPAAERHSGYNLSLVGSLPSASVCDIKANSYFPNCLPLI